MYDMLDEVCREIARNGFKKIILLNSHGGSPQFIRFFIQSTLYSKRDYVIYTVPMGVPEEKRQEVSDIMGSDDWGSHAGNMETSMVMALRPDLVKMNDIEQEGLKSYGRLRHLNEAYTAIGWYAEHPTQFAGDPSHACAKAGEKAYQLITANVAKIVKAIKDDDAALKLQDEFYSKW
jgi:creatinine amidohydrolase